MFRKSWAIIRNCDQNLHNCLSRRFPVPFRIADQIGIVIFKVICHPAFALIVGLLLVILVAANVVNTIVAGSIIFAWLVAMVWISRAEWISKLHLPMKVITLLSIGFILAISGDKFAHWALTQYQQQRRAQETTPPQTEKENRITFVSPIIIGQPKKQDQVTVPKQPLPQKESHIRQRRMELITEWRNGIENTEEVDFGDKAWYSSLRQYMKKEVIEMLERPRTFIVPGGRGKSPRKEILLDEVARIEKEWGLTGYSDEQPKQPSKEKTQQPVEPEQVQLLNRPYFAFYGPEIINATPELKAQFGTDYVVEVKVENKGRHTATNLFNRQIIVDQQFQIEPNISDGSKGNEFPPGGISSYYAGIKFPYETILPMYVIFAIRYQDKEILNRETFFQISCFRQPGANSKAPFLHFLEVSIPEREDILSHLKEELQDYVK